MLLRNEAKVGLLVFAAIVALGAMYWFLRGVNVGASTVHIYAIFRDAGKLDRGADIRMAGVKVGAVSSVTLTAKSYARIDMAIGNKTCIPSDSVARITTGGLIGDSYVDILPGNKSSCLKNDQKIDSAEPLNYERLISDVGELVSQLKESAAGINAVLGDKKTIENIKGTVAQMRTAAESTTKLLDSAREMVVQVSPDIQRAMNNMVAATDNAVKMTDELQSIVANDAAPATRDILQQAKDAMQTLNSAMTEARNIISGVGGSVEKIDGSLAKVDTLLQDMDKAVLQANDMMSNLTAATADIQGVTSDKEMQQNIKEMIRNAAKATAQANELIGTLNCKLGKITTSSQSKTKKAELPNPGLVSDALWNTDQGDYRFDANYTFGGFNGAFYRLGAFNIGESTRANLQAGRLLGSSTSLRYGLYASRLGFGVDQRLGNHFLLSADGFRPNDPEYDLRAVLKMGPGMGLYGGYSNVFDRKGDVFVGLQYKK